MKYLTKSGLKKLEDELHERKTKVRREIANEIKEAKEQGDLSENAEYTEARRKQRENESRIMELENVIRTSKVAEDNGPTGVIRIGSKFSVEMNGKENKFEIVGSNEIDPSGGKISNESPLGKAFLGKKKGEDFEIALPNGKKARCKILSVD